MAQKTPQPTREAPARHPAGETQQLASGRGAWLPHLLAIGLFLIVTVAYFSPVVFGKKELFQEDIVRYKGVAKEINDYRERTGEEALWTNALFSGMPAYQISVHYLSGKLSYLNKLFSLFLPHPAGMTLLCFIGFYFLLQVLRVDPWLSVMGALAFGLSSYFIIFIATGHNTKMAAITYFAPVLAGIILTYRGKLLPGAAVTALFLTMEVYVNHPQMTYYLGFVIVFYALAELVSAWREKRIADYFKRSAALGAAAAVALGVNITSLWATAEYSKHTIRGGTELTINPDGTKNTHNTTSGLDKDYATAWSYEVGETWTLLIPNIKGGESAPIGNDEDALKNIEPEKREAVAGMYRYFGDMQFTAGPVYAGAIVVFLFMLGLFLVKGPLKWALVLSTILSIWLSWGHHDPFGLSDFMLDHFPAYNKFRAVVTILVIALFTLPLLAAIGLDSLVKQKNFLKENIVLPFKQVLSGQKVLIAAFALSGGIALLCWMAPGMFTGFSAPGEYEKWVQRYMGSGQDVSEQQVRNYLNQVWPSLEIARKSIVQSDALRSFLFVLLAAIAIWIYARGIVNRKVLGGALIVLMLADLAVIDRRYLSSKNFVDKKDKKTENPFASEGRPNMADQMILQDKDPNYRVWNSLSRLDQDFSTSWFHKSIGGYHGAKLRRYQELIDFHIYRRNMGVINMLNTKYIIVPGDKDQPAAYPNRDALGNAWFVNEFRFVANADSEITALTGLDPSKSAIVDEKFKSELTGFVPKGDSLASIKLTGYDPKLLKYESNSSAEGLAVFSEIYYPAGWNAYVDGKLTPHFRVNYVLRAMRIPAGKHAVEFKFEPKVISTGETISMASLVVLFLFCAGAGFMEFRKKKSNITA